MPAPWARGARVRIVGQLHGSETVNVLHFATNTQGTDADVIEQQLIALAQAVIACVRQTLLPAVTSDWTLVRVEAQLIYPTVTDAFVETGTPADVGELGPTSVSFAASLVNIRTFGGGRRGRGRVFLPPPGETEVTASAMDEATLLLLTQFLLCIAGKFMGPDHTEDYILGVLSRTDAGPTNANFDVGFREARALNPVARLARMGSRKVGVGS